MVMKNLIKKILKEDEGNKVVKNYVTKMWKKQQDSGEIPRINSIELRKRNLDKNIDQIREWYFDFVGGPEEAFKLFDKYIEGRTISDVDLRKSGVRVHPDDIFKVKIYKIYNKNFDPGDELEFVFDIVSGQFITNQGVLTLRELYKDEYDDTWVDVTDHLRSEIEFYILGISEGDFGLYFEVATSHWY
jgi:hypothetical protein